MKVCIINNFPPYSGVGRITHALWNYLKNEPGVEADLYSTHAMRLEDLKLPENKGVKFLHSFPYVGNEYLSRFFIYLVDKFRIPQGYDIYHTSNQMISFMMRKKRLNVITLMDVAQLNNFRDKDLGIPFVNDIYNWVIRRSLRNSINADAIICISQNTKNEAVKLIGLDPNKGYVSHPGIYHDKFRPLGKEESRKELKLPLDKKILFHVGIEMPRKNVNNIIKAMSKCAEDTIFVRLGSRSTAGKDLAEELGLKDRVLYRSFEKDISKYYSAADVLVFPSLEEGFGLPIIEAMSCGCPVITSNYGAMREVAGDAALLVDPGNVDEITEAISKILSFNTTEREKMIQIGFKRANEFSWDKYSRKVLKVYKEILKKKKGETSPV